MNYCEMLRKIKENPLLPAPPLTIRQFGELSQHVRECIECADIVDEVCEQYQDVQLPPTPWDNTSNN